MRYVICVDDTDFPQHILRRIRMEEATLNCGRCLEPLEWLRTDKWRKSRQDLSWRICRLLKRIREPKNDPPRSKLDSQQFEQKR